MRLMRILLLVLLVLTLFAAIPPASADPPGPGDKICSPGKNNVGGGPGNSGPGDKKGAPLKPAPSCPGPDN